MKVRIDSWKRQDAAEQSRSWSRAICGKQKIPRNDRMPQSRAIFEGNIVPEKITGCFRAEQFVDGKDS